MVNMMNNPGQHVRDAETALRGVFEELGAFSFHFPKESEVGKVDCDAILRVAASDAQFDLGIEAKARITPQTAWSVRERMQRLPDRVIGVVYAPVISRRVAEILDEFSVGYVDQAGNCRLRSARHHLLIDRQGRKPVARLPQGTADPFSVKSSRIVRAMLAEPAKGWKVRELADHADVQVSAGLVVKVKRTLLEESYAVERERLLYLRDAVGLLENWARRYPGPSAQVPMFFLGDAEAAEEAVAGWCRANDLQYALAGFSAAWRLAPEVRYSVAAVYVEDLGFDRAMLEKLGKHQGGKRVETGANLTLLRPFDRSVFVNARPAGTNKAPVTSAIQTYLDLKKMAGRGEEAAAALFDRMLAGPMREAAQRTEGMQHDDV